MTTGAARYTGTVGGKDRPDQAARRMDMTVQDQHGRDYHIIYDTASQVVIRAQPLFKAPWLPHDADIQKSIVIRNRFPMGMLLDYDRLLKENREARERVLEELRRLAGQMNGIQAHTAYQSALNGKWADVPAALMTEVGWIPEPDDYILAAKAGNSWVLGLSPDVPAWAGPLIKLKELFRRISEVPVTDAMLDKYRDGADAPDDLDEQVDPEAMGGKVVPVGSVKVTGAPASPEKKRRGRPPKGAGLTD